MTWEEHVGKAMGIGIVFIFGIVMFRILGVNLK